MAWVALKGFEVVLGGGMFVRLVTPEVPTDVSRSLEAAGRRRGFLISGPPGRLSLECEGRMAEDFGMGKREVGLGRALGLPGCDLLSSIVNSCAPLPLISIQTRDLEIGLMVLMVNNGVTI